MKKFTFQKGAWDTEELLHTYSPMCRDYTQMRQEDDAIANSFNEKLQDYDYIGLALKEPVRGDATVRVRCSFESYGAPLIVLADGVRTDGEGRRLYTSLHEIAAYEKGCNVWRVVTVPDSPERPFCAVGITRETFDVAAGSTVEMTVQVRGKKIHVTVNDYSFDAELPALPEEYYVGITACEGLNRFYELTVE